MNIDRLVYRTSLLKTDIIISYYRGLSAREKNKFLRWFVIHPFSTEPQINKHFSSYFTSVILENNSDWLRSDPIVRLHLFAETIHEIFYGGLNFK